MNELLTILHVLVDLGISFKIQEDNAVQVFGNVPHFLQFLLDRYHNGGNDAVTDISRAYHIERSFYS